MHHNYVDLRDVNMRDNYIKGNLDYVACEHIYVMVAYFCHHLSESDLYVDLSVIYVDLEDLYVDLSEKYHFN